MNFPFAVLSSQKTIKLLVLFFCILAWITNANSQNYTLTLSKSGTGGGTVTSTPGGISCGATCSYIYPAGTSVQITAAADATSGFSGWSGGGTSGTGTQQTVVMNSDINVNATFTRSSYALNVSLAGTGSGSVTSLPAGIACPGDCDQNYLAGTIVSLMAVPDVNSVFAGWSGECSGTGTCNVSIASINNVTATFNYTSNNYYADNDGDGFGAGAVIIAAVQPENTSINNLDCDDSNSSVHPGATEICSNSTDDNCNNVVDDCIMFTLTLSKSGTGGGTVTSTPGGISCGATCSYAFPAGTSVLITAAADATSGFSGWSGGGTSGTGTQQTVVMNSDINVSATFTRSSYILNVSPAGTGSGTVTSVPAGISCPADCAENYTAGTLVSLIALPNAGSLFTGWTGGCTGTGACSLSMMSAKTVVPTFCLLPDIPGIISGSPEMCSGTIQTYSIEAVPNATSYSWTLPSGWTGNSTSNSITATAGTSGIISVVARNSCGSGPAKILNVTVNPMPLDLDIHHGMVAYYPLNNNVKDASGNGNNGTVLGPVPAPGRDSKVNGAYKFDGSDDYILIHDPVPASLQIQNEITLSAWIYAQQYPGVNNLGLIVGSQYDGMASGATIFLDGRINSDGQPNPPGHIHFQIGNGVWHHSNTNSQVPLNQWVHIVATRKANENARIYFNGVLQPLTSVPWNGNISYSGAYFAIGRQKDYNNRFFKGSIDDVRVYNRALSEREVRTLYQDKSTYTASDTICEKESTTIYLLHSELAMDYQLQKNGSDIGSTQTGNGDTISFNTGILNATSQFTIKATHTASSCSLILDTILTVFVNPAYAFTEDHSICAGETFTWQGTDYTEAGTYSANYSTIRGCDSTYTLNLTVNPLYSFTEDYSICAGETFTWQGTDYTEAGTYSAHYSTIRGCDSTYMLNLTVNPLYSFTEDYSICAGETFTWQGTDYTEAGTYSAHYSTIRGCDSTYTLNLTVNPLYSFTEDYSICAGETFTWQGTDYTEAGTYSANYSTIRGCDSTYTLNLTVNPLYSFTEDHSICAGETFTWQGGDYTEAGTYMVHYRTIRGCDSTYTLNLTVNPVYAFTEDHSICAGETFTWQGTNYTEAGTYSVHYNTIRGCDSTYTLNLTLNTVDVSISVNDLIITSNATGANYQWLNCENEYSIITGETSQSFIAQVNGKYAVQVSQGSCTDTSEYLQIILDGIATLQTEEISIFPNPVKDELIIENKGNREETDIEILNSSGQIVFHGNLYEKAIVSTGSFSPGFYIIKLKKGMSVDYKKIIKE